MHYHASIFSKLFSYNKDHRSSTHRIIGDVFGLSSGRDHGIRGDSQLRWGRQSLLEYWWIARGEGRRRGYGTSHRSESNPGLLLRGPLLVLRLLLLLLLLLWPLLDLLHTGILLLLLLRDARLLLIRLILLLVQSRLTAHIPGPVARLQLVAVHQSAGATLQQRPAKDAHIILAAVRGMRIVAKLLGTIKVCRLDRARGRSLWLLRLARRIHSERPAGR